MKSKLTFFLLFLIAGSALAAPKPTVAIMDLQCQGLSGPDAVLITDRLLSELGKIGTYDIVERAKREKTLRDAGHKLTQSRGHDQ